MAITGPYPYCTPNTLLFPSSISFEDEAVPFSFDVSNVGDEDTPSIEWGFIVELFLTQGEYVTVHRFPYSLPSTFVIPSLESRTVSGEFHPSRTHTSFSKNVYYDLGQALTQGVYEYQITVNRTVNGNFYFAHDQAGYQDGNDYFQDNEYGSLTILGTAEFKSESVDPFECGTIVPFKSVIRDKIIRCGVIGDAQTTKTVTRPKTTTTTFSSQTGTTTTQATTTTTTLPPTTTTTETITVTDPTITITQTDTIPPDPDRVVVRTNDRITVEPITTTTDLRRQISVPTVSVSDINDTTTTEVSVSIPTAFTDTVAEPTTTTTLPTGNRTITVATGQTNTQFEEVTFTFEPTDSISVIISNALKTLQTDTVRLSNELTVRPVKYVFVSNIEPIATVVTNEPIPIRKDPIVSKSYEPVIGYRQITPKPIVSTKPYTTYEKIGIQDPVLPGDLQFIISPGRVEEILPILQGDKTTPLVPDDSNLESLLGTNEFKDEFLLAARIKELADAGEVATVYYDPKPPERVVPLKFTSLEEGELKKAQFNINSPIINYWEAIDISPPEVPIEVEVAKVNDTITYRNVPKNYVPFAKTKKLDKIEKVEPTRITVPGLAAVDPDSFQKRGDFKPYIDQYGLMYSNGFPVSKNLINKLWKYYTAIGDNPGLQYITEDVRFDYPSTEEVQGELFNSLAGNGLIWPDRLPSWLIPWYQQNTNTLAGSFLVFNPRLYSAAKKALGFQDTISLLVETPKEERAELAFDRDSVLPDKLVLMLRGNDKDNIKSFKTGNAFTDSSLAYYELITDVNEMTERFTPPGEVIYVHYDDPILRLLLHPAATISFSRSQLSLRSFGDQELVHTIPHTYIIIPTDDPRHTALRGTGSLSLSFGTRSLTLTQSTCPDEWAAPSKPVIDIVGSYIDVWGYDPFYNDYYLGDNYRYPEGTFKLVFSDTVKNFKPFTTNYKYISLSKNIFEQFLDSQNDLTTNDVSPSFTDIIGEFDTKDLLTLQGALQTSVLRELSEGDVTGRGAQLDADNFNPAQDSYYISTGDAVNDVISDFLDAQLTAAYNADSDIPTFPPASQS